ncbi:TolC family protein [Granulicella sp. dw_53]|uniref:TolC family protein n=1 Tax=Granulicella sp. dw_53 TaxID=2719792 RepID=UPI001BD6C9E3|nr:TolC family protein [Granulicella sp. dw_53]
MSFNASQSASHSILMTLFVSAAPKIRTPRRLGLLRALVAASFLVGAATSALAQISFTTAIDLALRNSPRVGVAQADVNRSLAALRESRDVYIPSLVGSAGLAYSYGAPLGQPTLFTITSQSLLYNAAQRDYISAARAGLEAANQTLREIRQQVAEDAAITYLALDRAQQRRNTMIQEQGFSTRLVSIVQVRLDAGQENTTEFLKARRTSAQIHLQLIQLEDEVDSYADHLARLTGLPATNLLTVTESIPAFPTPSPSTDTVADSPGVKAAFANVTVKRQINAGDKRYLFRPQVTFFAQYSRFSNINNYSTYYPAFSDNTLNAAAIGGQITVPLYDRVHRDKVLESSADLLHAEQDARNIRNQFQEGRLKLQHASSELSARVELASIDRELAQNQLDVLLVQLQAGGGSGSAPLMTPKDEQNARIQERQRFLELLDADFQLHQVQINLLRQSGQLEDWLKSASQSQSVTSELAPH